MTHAKRRRFWIGGVAAAFVALAACTGGGSNPSDGGSDALPTCTPPNFELPECQACITTSCQDAAATACNDNNAFVDCYCPCAAKATGNMAKEQCAASCASSSCMDVASTCLATVLGPSGPCVTACGSMGPDDGGPPNDGSSGDGLDGDGGCSGNTVACYHAPSMTGQGGTCQGTENVPDAAVQQLNQLCTGQQGMPMTHCPSDSTLIGCCTDAKGCGESTTCSYLPGYTPQDVTAMQMNCMQQNTGDVVATFSTTPP
jgi:hypothetical protein